MAQPTWVTAAGSLGVIPEGIYYQQDLLASTPVLTNTPTVTASSSSTNRFTCSSTSGIYAGLNVTFVGTPFGGVNTYTRYFVFEVYNSTEFSISTTEFSTSPIALSTDSGSMTAEFTQHIYYRLIAGNLPPGIQVSDNGSILGVPQAVASVQGVPQEVSQDITFTFAIRAYTKTSTGVLDRLIDRTFTLTVTGQDVPEFITPAGNIGTYYDGTKVSTQILFTDNDPADRVIVKLVTGQLPPGIVINRHGLIAGLIEPLVGPPGTALAGYDATPKDLYPNDFTTRSTSQNFQFTLEVTDGKGSNFRTFEIYVYSKDSMTADAESVIEIESGPPPVYDNSPLSADNTWITADVIPTRTPVLITPAGDLGRIRSDNYYYFQFQAIDFDGDALSYQVSSGLDTSPPPGLILDTETGWLFGNLVQQGPIEVQYEFTITVYKTAYPNIRSAPTTFTMTVIGDIDTEVIWLTEPDLGVIDNGSTSTLSVAAVNVGGRALQYRIVSGSDSQLPQGLTLLPSGNIVGKVSFNTFALDGGTTTFDVQKRTRLDPNPTTFDLEFNFTINAYAPQTDTVGYQVTSISVTNGGSGYSYSNPPTVTISAPPPSSSSVQATIGSITIVSGVITAISINNIGNGYLTIPTVVIAGGAGSGATAVAQVTQANLINAVSVFRRFTVTINRAFNEPYESLYIKCMPPASDRALIDSLIQNQDIIPVDTLYRADDSNFGVAQNVTYTHVFGLNAVTLDQYVQSLRLNHYWRDITLGEIRTAQALDSAGNVIYEVVYSAVIDNLLNNAGASVGKQVTLPYPVVQQDGTITVVYPNSLPNMRNQVIDVVGQLTPGLPLWMTSKQSNGSVLGFVPAWVIAYVKPGESGKIAYNIQQEFGNQLNLIDFEVDRYELDRSLSHNWVPYEDSTQAGRWEPYPPAATTFDINAHYQLPEPNDSSFVFTGGTGYAVNDRIRILGSQLGGTVPANNVIITVTEVDNIGTILSARAQGTAPLLSVGDTYTNITGTNISGTGIGATWDIITVGEDVTVFDGGATRFISPADRWTDTDAYDKYLVFPKQTILG